MVDLRKVVMATGGTLVAVKDPKLSYLSDEHKKLVEDAGVVFDSKPNDKTHYIQLKESEGIELYLTFHTDDDNLVLTFDDSDWSYLRIDSTIVRPKIRHIIAGVKAAQSLASAYIRFYSLG